MFAYKEYKTLIALGHLIIVGVASIEISRN